MPKPFPALARRSRLVHIDELVQTEESLSEIQPRRIGLAVLLVRLRLPRQELRGGRPLLRGRQAPQRAAVDLLDTLLLRQSRGGLANERAVHEEQGLRRDRRRRASALADQR